MKIGTLEPVELISVLSDDPALEKVAREVDTTLKAIIEEAM